MALSNSIPNSIVQPGVCTFTTRPSNPYVGQTIYETDTGNLLVYYGTTTGWKPPWNTAWGTSYGGATGGSPQWGSSNYGYLSNNSTNATTTTSMTVFNLAASSATWNFFAGRQYEFTLLYHPYWSSGGNARVVTNLSVGGVVKHQWLQPVVPSAGIVSSASVNVRHSATSTGGAAIAVNILSEGGNTVGNYGDATYINKLYIRDVGPADAAPSS